MPNASERAAAHNVGKYVRWPLLYQTEAPLIIAPIDDFLIFGPFAGLQNRRQRVKAMLGADIDTVLTFPGAIERNLDLFAQRHFVINLTASTTMNQHTRKTVVASVHRAVSLGASGVAAHINLTSQWASEMLDQAGMIVEEAAALGMPALGIVYPRGEIGETDNNFDDLKANDPLAYADMLAHCVSTGVDIGFDVIKTQFVGPS